MSLGGWPTSGVTHLRDCLIVAKVGIRAKARTAPAHCHTPSPPTLAAKSRGEDGSPRLLCQYGHRCCAAWPSYCATQHAAGLKSHHADRSQALPNLRPRPRCGWPGSGVTHLRDCFIVAKVRIRAKARTAPAHSHTPSPAHLSRKKPRRRWVTPAVAAMARTPAVVPIWTPLLR